MKINTARPTIAASTKRETATPGGSPIAAGRRHDGPDLVDGALMLAIGVGAGAVQSELGFSGFPVAMLGGTAIFAGANHIRASRQSEPNLSSYAGCFVGTAAFSAAHVASHFGLNPMIAAGVTSGALVSAIALAY